MSDKEIKEQHEQITEMATQISQASKHVKTLWPLISFVSIMVGGAFGLGISAVRYDNNVVKQPEYRKEVKNIYNRIDRDSLKIFALITKK